MQIIILSGLSGAGKSVALHMLEDLGYYCIDNMPAALLKPFIAHTVRSERSSIYARTAISLDARNSDAEISLGADAHLTSSSAAASTAKCCSSIGRGRRAAAALRRDPACPSTSVARARRLREAIASERRLAGADRLIVADQVIDTSRMGVHELRDLVGRRRR